jgi:hypothetical protein
MRMPRPRYADVAATLALVFALSGTAYAVAKLPANSVDTQSIQNGAVTGPKIAASAVTGTRVKNESLTGTDVTDQSLTADDLGTDSVQATEIADDSIDSGEIVNNSLFSSDIADGTLANVDFAANSVDGAKVANESLTLADMVGADVTGTVGAFALNGNQCAPISINIGGAQVGQAAFLSFTAAPPNAISWGPLRVSATNVVTTVVCNQSASVVSSPGQGIRIVTFG